MTTEPSSVDTVDSSADILYTCKHDQYIEEQVVIHCRYIPLSYYNNSSSTLLGIIEG